MRPHVNLLSTFLKFCEQCLINISCVSFRFLLINGSDFLLYIDHLCKIYGFWMDAKPYKMFQNDMHTSKLNDHLISLVACNWFRQTHRRSATFLPLIHQHPQMIFACYVQFRKSIHVNS